MHHVQRVTLVQRVVVLLEARHHRHNVGPRVPPFITVLVAIKSVLVRHLRPVIMPPPQLSPVLKHLWRKPRAKQDGIVLEMANVPSVRRADMGLPQEDLGKILNARVVALPVTIAQPVL